MDTLDLDLIDNLHLLSTEVINLKLEETSIFKICYIEDVYAFDDFLDMNSFVYQKQILETSKRKIEIILKNFDKAIYTNCNNNIDLNNYKLVDDFALSYVINFEEKRISKKYTINSITPDDPILFKIFWLKRLIADCSKIAWEIRSILNIPQPKKEETVDILKLIDETQKEEKKLAEQALEILSSSKPKELKLKEYYSNFLPKDIENIDNLFYWAEMMESSFNKKLGYLNNESEDLTKILSKLKTTYINKFDKSISVILEEDKKIFLSQYEKCIFDLKLKKEIEGLKISKFTKNQLKKIKLLLSNIDLWEVSKSDIKEGLKKSTSKENIETCDKPDTFETIITDESKRIYIYDILQQFNVINSERKSILTQRKKGALRGVVEALKEKMIVPDIGLAKLCKIIAIEIELELKSELDDSAISERYRTEAIKYINKHPLH